MDIIVIGGPTATGKTALSVEIAKAFNGEIVNADSMQIYQKMNIGTAKPTPEERGGVAHHLMDFVDPKQSFSVKDYVDLAHPLLRTLSQKGKLPIIVGGTGLYINSLVNCVSFPEMSIDPAITARLKEKSEAEGALSLHRELCTIDPELAAQLHPNNTRRVFRALEIYYASGKIPSEVRRESVQAASVYRPLIFAADYERSILYERIGIRVQKMLDAGLIDEVIKLRNEGCNLSHQSMQGIGYRETLFYLDGFLTQKELYEQICRNTRRYAKRQLTWFKTDSRVEWQKNGFDTRLVLNRIDTFLKNKE